MERLNVFLNYFLMVNKSAMNFSCTQIFYYFKLILRMKLQDSPKGTNILSGS